MGESKSASAATAAPKPERPAEPVVLADAGASGDPAVHQLLAERQTAVLNGDDDRAHALDAELAALGFK